MNPEQERIAAAYEPAGEPWLRWGPYLSERAWATVREDYSADGDAWAFFPHEQARSKAYRWNEDGLGGISDDHQNLCFAFAFWNGKDRILKERLFGVTGPQGNHGEDVKEVYFYSESTPSHSLLAMNYKYPQAAYPYEGLVEENRRRTRMDPEYEIWDTGAFAENRFFDIQIAYAKATPTDLHIEVTVTNQGPEAATLHLLPTLWFRNTWSWGKPVIRPQLRFRDEVGRQWIEAISASFGTYRLYFEEGEGEAAPEFLFTENETNDSKLYGTPHPGGFFKDGINDHVVDGSETTVNPAREGTKAAIHYRAELAPGASRTWRLRLTEVACSLPEPLAGATELFAKRREEADLFFRDIEPPASTDDERRIHRQALAGMLWSKQFYNFVVRDWLQGDPGYPAPPYERLTARNAEWKHLYNDRVMSMPDKWEYPWYASWDLAFHCIALVLADAEFAKGQLDLLVREWYQHPNGQIPAYEWNFGDVNPPVFAWAAWRVYKIDEKRRGGRGHGDRIFLESMFHKLLLNFTWWVNRKDSEGKNVFQGGFLGLDNIGVFDRSKPLPTGGFLEQSDATSWMGMFCLNMMKIALELAESNHAYENIATKFFEHFLAIAEAMNTLSGHGIGLWDEQDQFFYDMLNLPDGTVVPLRVRSLVGLMPLLAVETIEPEDLTNLPGFKIRLEWYLKHRPDLAGLISRWQSTGESYRRLVALVRGHRMKKLLRRMLDPNEFLSDYGIRSLSRFHKDNPFVFKEENQTENVVNYEPGESETYLFGGNSNWRGPVWFPINYLLIESLQKFHHYYGDDFKVECPTGSGVMLTLDQIADELSRRLIGLFTQKEDGSRAFMGPQRQLFQQMGADNQLWFHEYFHGETGQGLGADHQTGWTGLVAKLIEQQAAKRGVEKPA